MTPKKQQGAGASGPGHNATELQQKSLVFEHVRRRIAHNAKIKAAQDAKKEDGLKAKADLQQYGIKLKDLDFLIDAMQAEDQKIVADRFKVHGMMLSWVNIVPGFQSDLFNDRMPQRERIERSGELAGYRKDPRESGYDKASDENQWWIAAYDRARKIDMDNLADAISNAEKDRQAGKKNLLKANKAGAKPNGDTPADKAKAKPPKPTSSKAQALEGEQTNAEKEGERQARADFLN